MFKSVWQGRLLGLRLVVFLAVVALLAIGQVAIRVADSSGFYAGRQTPFIAVALVAFALISLPPYRWFGRVAYGLYALAVALLALVLVGQYLELESFVPVVSGSTRWLILPGVPAARIQPSEVAKLAWIIALSWSLHQGDRHRRLRGLIKPFTLTLAPMLLIVLEPDLGTVLLFVPVLFAVLFAAGARPRHLLLIAGLGVLVSPLLYFHLADYQKVRIQVLLRQGETENVYWMRGPGFQLNQSKVCIGSGGLAGQGWGHGPFVRYQRFLPEKHNDFIFALIANQAGLVGCLAVLGLYLIIFVGGIEIAAQQNDPFGRLVAVGITALLATQMFINIGVTVGLMPTTGMTLPFVSYGGSSLVSSFLALGLLFNVARHRHTQLARNPQDHAEP